MRVWSLRCKGDRCSCAAMLARRRTIFGSRDSRFIAQDRTAAYAPIVTLRLHCIPSRPILVAIARSKSHPIPCRKTIRLRCWPVTTRGRGSVGAGGPRSTISPRSVVAKKQPRAQWLEPAALESEACSRGASRFLRGKSCPCRPASMPAIIENELRDSNPLAGESRGQLHASSVGPLPHCGGFLGGLFSSTPAGFWSRLILIHS